MARSGWLARALLLASSMLVVGLAMAPLAWQYAGPSGLLAEAVAGGFSLVGAVLGLAAFARFSRPDQVWQALAGGMLLRTFLPLAAAAVLYLKQRQLADAGFVLYLLVFYLPALALETVLVVVQAGNESKQGPARVG